MPSSKAPTALQIGPGRLPSASRPSLAVVPPPSFLVDGDYGDVVVAAGGTQLTVDNGVVSNPKLATMPANSIKVNATAGVANPSDLAVGTNSVVGRVAGVIVAAPLVNSQIGVGQIGNDRLLIMPTNTVKVNNTAGIGAPVDMAVGTNSVLGRVAGNIVAAPIVAAQIATDAVTTIKILNNNVTNAKLTQMAAATVKGRGRRDGTGDPLDLNSTALRDVAFDGARASPFWFDDFHRVADVAGPPRYLLTAEGAWRLTVSGGGSVDTLPGDLVQGCPGITRFTVSGPGSQSVVIDRGTFPFGTFKRLSFAVCRLFGNPTDAAWQIGIGTGTSFPASTNAAYMSATGAGNILLRTRSNGVDTANIDSGIATVADVFVNCSIERLASNALEFTIGATTLTPILAATHLLETDEAYYVDIKFGKSTGDANFTVDYAGCQFETTR